jgi:hypothetical protein
MILPELVKEIKTLVVLNDSLLEPLDEVKGD